MECHVLSHLGVKLSGMRVPSASPNPRPILFLASFPRNFAALPETKETPSGWAVLAQHMKQSHLIAVRHLTCS
jgi:hypothetical protein